jgi:hypothetical protein
VGLKLNGTHQLLVYTDYVYQLGDNIITIKQTQTLSDASKEVCLEVNVEKTKSHHQNGGQNRSIKIAKIL